MMPHIKIQLSLNRVKNYTLRRLGVIAQRPKLWLYGRGATPLIHKEILHESFAIYDIGGLLLVLYSGTEYFFLVHTGWTMEKIVAVLEDERLPARKILLDFFAIRYRRMVPNYDACRTQ